MFSCVWLHFKKFFGKYFLVFGKEEGKHKSENTNQKTQATARSRSRSDRDHGAIAIDSAIVIRIAINGAIAISPSSRDRD